MSLFLLFCLSLSVAAFPAEYSESSQSILSQLAPHAGSKVVVSSEAVGWYDPRKRGGRLLDV